MSIFQPTKRGKEEKGMPLPLSGLPRSWTSYLHLQFSDMVILCHKEGWKCSLYSRQTCAHHKLRILLLQNMGRNQVLEIIPSYHRFLPIFCKWKKKKSNKEYPYVSAFVHLPESIFGQIIIKGIWEVLEILLQFPHFTDEDWHLKKWSN